MALITSVTARQILDSRGVPTVEATVTLDSGITANSSVASGSVSSKLEALELRDLDNAMYFGQGVSKAVENINTVINQRLVGMDPLYQTQIDQSLVDLDGTTNKSRLGANAILAVSQAVMKAAAASLKLPVFMYVKEKYQLVDAYRIPTPIFNLLNGGRHGSGALDFQEFQLVPASHLPYSQSLRIGAEVFMALDKTLEQKGAIRTVGMEGGYSPNLASNTDALEIFSEAMRLTSYQLAKDAFLGLDVAPRWFYKGGKYTIKDRPQPMNSAALIKFYQDLHHQYRVFSFEDPLLPDDWNDWKQMTAEMAQTAMIVADDLICTNKTLLMKAIQEKACNAVVIKPNRAGTLTEAIEVISLAKKAGWHTIMSHRSGETNDTLMADIAVGVGTDYVKFGAPSRGERVAKYNRLLRIEETLLRSTQGTSQTTGVAPMEPTVQPTAVPADTSAVAPTAQAPAAPEPFAPVQPAPATPAPVASASPMGAATPFASVFGSAPVTPAPMPVSPAPEPTPVVPTPPVAVEPVPVLTPTPVEPVAPTLTSPAPAMPTEPAITPPESALPTPPATGATPAATELQSSVNELVQMVGTAPTAPTVAPVTETIPTEPVAPTTAPTAFPAGLTPPTPPTVS